MFVKNKIERTYNKYIQKYMDKKGYLFIPFRWTTYTYCLLDEKSVFVVPDEWNNPTVESLFTLLHEIGHLETNDMEMPDSQCEYLATEWAIKEFKKLKLELCEREKKEWQDYIFYRRKQDIDNGFEKLPSKKKLMLAW